ATRRGRRRATPTGGRRTPRWGGSGESNRRTGLVCRGRRSMTPPGEVTEGGGGGQGAVIFIATNRRQPARRDSEGARVPGLVEFVEANEPRLIAFNEYVNEAG